MGLNNKANSAQGSFADVDKNSAEGECFILHFVGNAL